MLVFSTKRYINNICVFLRVFWQVKKKMEEVLCKDRLENK